MALAPLVWVPSAALSDRLVAACLALAGRRASEARLEGRLGRLGSAPWTRVWAILVWRLRGSSMAAGASLRSIWEDHTTRGMGWSPRAVLGR